MTLRIFVVVVWLASGPVSGDTDRPIVGILSLPLEGDRHERGAYIAASYVKFVEAGGARAVPIDFDIAHDDLLELLSHLNGVLLTGGGADLDPHKRVSHSIVTIVDYVLNENANGRALPLFGICLGFEAIAAALSRLSIGVLDRFDALDIAMPLEFTPNAWGGRMFPATRPDGLAVFQGLQTLNITYNHHVMGVTPAKFQATLSSRLRVVATNVDRALRRFVSAFEGVEAPIFGVQFHPEKPLFEWASRYAIPHTGPARSAGQYLADLFIDACKRSHAKFPSEQAEDAHLIYNFSPTFTGKQGSMFVQEYRFPPVSARTSPSRPRVQAQ